MQSEWQKRVNLLESALDAVSEGIIITDTRGRIIYYNEALEKMEGQKEKEVTGRFLTEVYPGVTPETSEHMAVVETGEPVKEVTKMYFTADGREINILASTYPVWEKGRVIGAYSVCRDVTRIKDLLSRNILLQKQMQAGSGENPLNNGTRYTFEHFIYTSLAMDRIVRQAQKAAKTDCTVLVYGETGTGKEVLVQSIHNASARRAEPFVGINCAAIPETLLESILFGTVKGAFTGAVSSPGLFEQAGGGTLFLDEINSMSPQLQAKLLRVLQERNYRRLGANKELPVRCRIFTSTNMDPQECIDKGALREDLYYRFAVFTVLLPPLRERPEDIEKLASYFLRRYSGVYGQGVARLDPELKISFLRYQWPGNVRELEHVIESCLAMLDPGEDTVIFDHLPAYVRPRFIRGKPLPAQNLRASGSTLHQILADTERRVIESILQNNRGNITQSARELGIQRQNLQYRMRRLGIRAAGLMD
ncbi:MAG: sigma 54-interacting transcriptional regulator [Firmicutes bacterium]|nr:sigma 54-interacting transcriptional regulator [Bacillota bacterium]